MTEEKFEDFLKRALADLDSVPPTPRAAIWARIERERAFTKSARRHPVWLKLAVGLAAVLAIGIGIGRLTVSEPTSMQPRVAMAPTTNVAEPVNRTAYNVTVAQHLTSAEALLTSFRTQPQGTLEPDIAGWARDLLTNTRLLLDSPAADDPEVAALLRDLELIIAQIARMSAPSSLEREIIRDGMKKTEVLSRLRASQAVAT
ncbi:MAG: hypothetical protein ACT4O1_14925 [Gemmatimonadota bacterium]